MKSALKPYRIMTSLSEGSLANRSVSPEINAALLTPEERSSSQLQKLLLQRDLNAYSSKTSRDCCQTTLEELSSQSSVRWMNWGTMSNGVCLTQKISESPKIANESTLRDILETGKPWREARPAELDNAKSRSNGGPHRPIRFPNEIQKALTVQDSYRLIVGSSRNGQLRVRRHTITECERLQGFPDNWTRAVPEKEGFKLLGNAVTTNVIDYIASAIKNRFRHLKHLSKQL